MIPVSSLILSSKFCIHVLLSLAIECSSSNSKSKPLRIMPPSRTEKGGSSTIAASKVVNSSWCKCTSSHNCCKSLLLQYLSKLFISGSTASEERNETRSRALALPTSIRETIRSKSKIAFNLSCRLPRICTFVSNSPTASCLDLICDKSSKGHSIQFLSLRAPMEVEVKSSTSNNVPRLEPSRIFFISSKFLTAVASKFINCSLAMRDKLLICDKSALTVTCR